jgi:hypothetical protein
MPVRFHVDLPGTAIHYKSAGWRSHKKGAATTGSPGLPKYKL